MWRSESTAVLPSQPPTRMDPGTRSSFNAVLWHGRGWRTSPSCCKANTLITVNLPTSFLIIFKSSSNKIAEPPA